MGRGASGSATWGPEIDRKAELYPQGSVRQMPTSSGDANAQQPFVLSVTQESRNTLSANRVLQQHVGQNGTLLAISG